MLSDTIQLGTPVVHRGIVVAPLFPRRQPVADYVTSDVAIPLGFRVAEVDAAGSVPELRADNPLDRDVLLYDGEELVGAKQNRILNVSVLVGAKSEALIPVSCVEQGRWNARGATFDAAGHTAYPDLRRRKAEHQSAAPLERGIAQSVVWDEVRAKASLHDVASPTGAQDDIYRARHGSLAELERAFAPVAGQSGAVLAIGGRLTLDFVSRPDAWERLHPRIVRGYALDALERLDGEAAAEEDVAAFIAAVTTAPSTSRASAARGDDVRLAGRGLVGSALVVDGEVVQLSAFTSDRDVRAATIARPSRRR